MIGVVPGTVYILESLELRMLTEFISRRDWGFRQEQILNGFRCSATEFAFYPESDGEPCRTCVHENDMTKSVV